VFDLFWAFGKELLWWQNILCDSSCLSKGKEMKLTHCENNSKTFSRLARYSKSADRYSCNYAAFCFFLATVSCI